MVTEARRAPAPAGPNRFVVARADEVAAGERLIAEVGGRKIGIFNVAGEYHAILYLCPHSGGPLCEGQLVEHVYAERPGEIRHDPGLQFLACPWHGWIFDLRSGQSWSDPGRVRARRFAVDVQRGEELKKQMELTGPSGDAASHDPGWVPGPYAVEKFPVQVEDEYIVVTMRPRAQCSPTDASP